MLCYTDLKVNFHVLPICFVIFNPHRSFLLFPTHNTTLKITPEAASKYPDLDDLVNLYSRRNQQAIFWEDQVHAHLSIVDAQPNKLVWEFDVEEKHCNQLSIHHPMIYYIKTYQQKLDWAICMVVV